MKETSGFLSSTTVLILLISRKICLPEKKSYIYFLTECTNFIWNADFTWNQFLGFDFTKYLSSETTFLVFPSCSITQCGNCCNLISHISCKNFMKATFLLKILLKSWFDEMFFGCRTYEKWKFTFTLFGQNLCESNIFTE